MGPYFLNLSAFWFDALLLARYLAWNSRNVIVALAWHAFRCERELFRPVRGRRNQVARNWLD